MKQKRERELAAWLQRHGKAPPARGPAGGAATMPGASKLTPPTQPSSPRLRSQPPSAAPPPARLPEEAMPAVLLAKTRSSPVERLRSPRTSGDDLIPSVPAARLQHMASAGAALRSPRSTLSSPRTTRDEVAASPGSPLARSAGSRRTSRDSRAAQATPASPRPGPRAAAQEQRPQAAAPADPAAPATPAQLPQAGLAAPASQPQAAAAPLAAARPLAAAAVQAHNAAPEPAAAGVAAQPALPVQSADVALAGPAAAVLPGVSGGPAAERPTGAGAAATGALAGLAARPDSQPAVRPAQPQAGKMLPAECSQPHSTAGVQEPAEPAAASLGPVADTQPGTACAASGSGQDAVPRCTAPPGQSNQDGCAAGSSGSSRAGAEPAAAHDSQHASQSGAAPASTQYQFHQEEDDTDWQLSHAPDRATPHMPQVPAEPSYARTTSATAAADSPLPLSCRAEVQGMPADTPDSRRASTLRHFHSAPSQAVHAAFSGNVTTSSAAAAAPVAGSDRLETCAESCSSPGEDRDGLAGRSASAREPEQLQSQPAERAQAASLHDSLQPCMPSLPAIRTRSNTIDSCSAPAQQRSAAQSASSSSQASSPTASAPSQQRQLTPQPHARQAGPGGPPGAAALAAGEGLAAFAARLFAAEELEAQCAVALTIDVATLGDSQQLGPRALQRLKDAAVLLSFCLGQLVARKEVLLEAAAHHDRQAALQRKLLVDRLLAVGHERDAAAVREAAAAARAEHLAAALQARAAQLAALKRQAVMAPRHQEDGELHFDKAAWLRALGSGQ